MSENVALPLILAGHNDHHALAVTADALGALDLAELADKLPEEISGGQAQRVAVARALAGRPGLILADEPTGQLDAASATAVIAVLLKASRRSGAGLVISTHDLAVADVVAARWELHNGELTVPDAEAAWSR